MRLFKALNVWAVLALIPFSSLCFSQQKCRLNDAEMPDDVTITQLQMVDAGETLDNVADAELIGRTFCRIVGLIETEIGFELWLPMEDQWNGHFVGAGVGGQAGSIAHHELARAVSEGYAAASTDTGHVKSDTQWLLNRPDRALNYAERANHLLAQRSRAIIKLFYGRPLERAIFIGCSGGGRQALTEMQRYPDDYDGIIAGAPGVNTPEMSVRRLWEMIQHERYQGVLADDDWKWIAEQGQGYCDRHDGTVDGVAADPMSCDFSLSNLSCKHASADERCLSDRQLSLAQRLYAPLKDEAGNAIDEGLLPGIRVSPVAVPEPFTPGPSYLATVLFAQGVHGDPDWDVRQLSISQDLAAIDRVMNLHADDPDVDAFKHRGGKLILYHGLADALVAPQSTVRYFQKLQSRYVEKGGVTSFAQLYLIPGMTHCRGGGVPDRFGGAGGFRALPPKPTIKNDMLKAMLNWLDTGVPPALEIGVR